MPIKRYYQELKKLKIYSNNESSLKRPFFDLVSSYLQNGYVMVEEYRLKYINKIPDAVIFNSYGVPIGYIENKDAKDDLHYEIAHKLDFANYPKDNTIFQNTKTLILYQDGSLVDEINMEDEVALNKVLNKFINHKTTIIKDYEAELSNFIIHIPQIANLLTNLINSEIKDNIKFKESLHNFLQELQATINPFVKQSDVVEIIIQHILTQDIFSNIFSAYKFHQQNNIAKNINILVNLLDENSINMCLKEISKFYEKIVFVARFLPNYGERQKFLKELYQKFYASINAKKADRLGIVYTPNEVVDFIINTSNELLKKHFNKQIASQGVEVLDPCAGTGVFITNLLKYLQFDDEAMINKYKDEIHCNEVDILPYYIANLNIENVYAEILQSRKLSDYFTPYNNICLVDTLENIRDEDKTDLIGWGGEAGENLERVKNQQSKKISLIIGNPPYNANQKSMNDNNANKIYKSVDERIKNTYVVSSEVQNKNKQYDMYKRFVRWACDRIGESGIVAFITNGSFVNSKQDDGFRKTILQEFDYVYIYDLKGNARVKNIEEGGNIFNIQTPVAIMFLVKTKQKEHKVGKLFYASCQNKVSAKAKLQQLQYLKNKGDIEHINFKEIIPDSNNNWVDFSNNDFANLTPLLSKNIKALALKNPQSNFIDVKSIFKIFSLGVNTSRDDWVYDADKNNLEKKVQYFINSYNTEVEKYKNLTFNNNTEFLDSLNYEIKWSEDLINSLKKLKNIPIFNNNNNIHKCLYRPFVENYVYLDSMVIDRLYKNLKIFPTPDTKNMCINFNNTDRLDFSPFIANKIINLTPLVASASQSIPLHYYINGEKYSNITTYALSLFKEHYKNNNISDEDIFYYCYGILNNPTYKEKYKNNLKQNYPALCLYKDFESWKNWGKELANLHLNYNDLEAYNVNFQNIETKSKNFELKISNNNIQIGNIALIDIPPQAFEYKLGGKPILKWVLDGYKQKKLNPQEEHHKALINNNLTYYNEEKIQKTLVNLIPKLITMCIATNNIHKAMETQEI